MWWHLLLFQFVILRTFKIFDSSLYNCQEQIPRISGSKISLRCIGESVPNEQQSSRKLYSTTWNKCSGCDGGVEMLMSSHWGAGSRMHVQLSLPEVTMTLWVNDHKHSRSCSLELSIWKSLLRVRRVGKSKYCKNFPIIIIIASALPQLKNWLND